MALAAWRWGQKIVFSSHPVLTKKLGTWKTRDEGLGVPLARWRLSRRCGCPHQLEWCFPCLRQEAKSHSSELISSLCKETEGAGEKKLRLREVQSLSKTHGERKVERAKMASLSQKAVQETAVSRGWILAPAWKDVGEDWQGSVSQLSHHKMNDGERRKGPDPSAWRQDARATQSRVFQEKKLRAVQGTSGQQRCQGRCQPLGPLFPQL